MSPRLGGIRYQSAGLALVGVLWMVASLSILVTGLMYTVKSEVKIAATMRDVVVAGALGEGAMNILLRSVMPPGQMPQGKISAEILFSGAPIKVEMMPLTGYIDINSAPIDLLNALFAIGGNLTTEAASELAEATLATRSEKDAQGRGRGFEAVEDLMRVPGMSYALYERVAPLVTADVRGSGKVNAFAASPDVLKVLSGGNANAALTFNDARDAGDTAPDLSSLNGAWLDSATSSLVEIRALVPMPGGVAVLVVRRVAIGQQASDGLPWRVFYTDTRYKRAASAGP